MSAFVLSQIFIYPIKSLGGISVEASEVQARGLKYDRRWMLVDEQGMFLTQRTFSDMALLQVALLPECLQVTHRTKNLAPLHVPYEPTTNKTISVTVWDDVCDAVVVSPEADQWFTTALNRNCRLVFMPDTTQRQVDLKYAQPGEVVSFADGYPILVIGQESLNDLNTRLEDPVPMNRFRPSLVFTGGPAFSEDTWRTFTINNLHFKGVKPCARCVLTTIDQQTARKGKEPLYTLTSYRQLNHKVLFGQNVLPVSTAGTLRIGDPIEVSQFGPGPFSS